VVVVLGTDFMAEIGFFTFTTLFGLVLGIVFGFLLLSVFVAFAGVVTTLLLPVGFTGLVISFGKIVGRGDTLGLGGFLLIVGIILIGLALN